jgi:Group II intron, maturase-specific domain
VGEAVPHRRREALAKLDVRLNDEKSWIGELRREEGVGFVGVDCRRVRAWRGCWRPQDTPTWKQCTALRRELQEVVRRLPSLPVEAVSAAVNPQRRGGVNDFRSGQASRGCACVRQGIEKKVRRPLRRARTRRGVGGKRWSPAWLDDTLGLFGDDRGRDLSLA